MLNKKILAAAIAATLSTAAANAISFIPTQAKPAGDAPTIFASELATLNSNGLLVVADATAGILDATFKAGFTIGAGTSKYIRIDLNGGEFTANSAPMLTATLPSNNSPTVSLSQGGTAGDTFAVFEVAAPANEDITAAQAITLESSEYAISDSMNVTASTYEFAADAVNQNDLLASTTGTLAVISAGTDGEFVNFATSTATVKSKFEKFEGSTIGTGTTPVVLGQIAPGEILLDVNNQVINSYTAAGELATPSDFVTSSQDVTISGDFSFGNFTLSPSSSCGTANPFKLADTDNGEITFEGLGLIDTNDSPVTYSLCVAPFVDTTDGVVIEKGDYLLETEDGVNDVLGRIVYDTLSIEVPYLTTFSEYNQRVYLINNGGQDADYSMTFTSEGDTDAEAGILASGTIPAGEMIVLRASDLVTLDGKTRTSATIEVSGTEANISASMQTVNLETGTTDTVVLNANSIVEAPAPVAPQ